MGLALTAAVALGCVTSRDISMRVLDYNVAAENARSEMLLLNVLRARDRRPMVFTGLTSISGSLRASSGIGAAGSIGRDASDQAGISANVSLTDSPSFNVAVLDSQEFTRGIMRPITFELLEYLWDQGFNREVMFYLTVERIELECPSDEENELRLLINDYDESSFDRFSSFIELASDRGTWEVDPHQVEQVGPPVDKTEVERLSTLIQIAGRDLRLREVGDARWQLEKPSSGLRLVATVDPCDTGSETQVRLYESKGDLRRAQQLAPEEPKGRIVLRSPQSVLYFLGELTRPDRERDVMIRKRRPDQPEFERRLFVIADARECADAIISVGYGGKQQRIPRGEGACHPGRSMQSLSLATQLLSLQQSSKDLPATGTLRVIGQ